jgi:aspartate/methionine/tyrosine aminotransferase/ketopantoate reductase
MLSFKVLSMPSLPNALVSPQSIENMGGETAFVVSQQASNHQNAHPGSTVIRLNVGDVKALTPPSAYAEGIKSVVTTGREITYGKGPGEDATRKAFADYVDRTYGFDPTANSIIVTTAKFGIDLVTTTLNPDTSVVIHPSISYPMYKANAQEKQIPTATYPFTMDWTAKTATLDLKELETALKNASETGKTAHVWINDVGNPTGHIYTPAEAEQLRQLAVTYPNSIFHFDTAYEEIRFGNEKSALKSLMQELYDAGRCTILISTSKMFALTGERSGALVIPETLEIAVNGTHKSLRSIIAQKANNSFSCPPRSVQAGMTAALNDPATWDTVAQNNEELKARRDLLSSGLDRIGIPHIKPEGGFYIWANAEPLMQDLGFKSVEGLRIALLDAGVSVCTSVHFGDPTGTGLRFAFSSTTQDEIQRAVTQLETWIHDRKASQDYFNGKSGVVLGGGDVGQMLTHTLTRGNVDVTLVTHHSYTDVHQHGIKVTYPVPTESQPQLAHSIEEMEADGRLTAKKPLDFVIIATQIDSNPATIALLQRLEREGKITLNTVIICEQNGLRTATCFAEAFPTNPIGKGIISVQNRKGEKPGEHVVPLNMGYVTGHVSGDPEQMSQFAKSMRGMGVYKADMIPQTEVLQKEWEKLAKNMANFAVLSLAQSGKGKIYADLLQEGPDGEQARQTLKTALEELSAVAKKDGVSLGEAEALYRTVITYAGTDHICTTLGKYQEGGPIENLIGPITALAKKYGIDTPTLDALEALVHTHNQAPKAHTLTQIVPTGEIQTRKEACLRSH